MPLGAARTPWGHLLGQFIGSDVLSSAIAFFEYFFTELLGVELEVPRAVFYLVLEVESFVVWDAILPHAP